MSLYGCVCVCVCITAVGGQTRSSEQLLLAEVITQVSGLDLLEEPGFNDCILCLCNILTLDHIHGYML